MKFFDVMKQNKSYAARFDMESCKMQLKAKQLCFEYNKTGPMEKEKRDEILKELFGTYNGNVVIEPSFHCDYGFNIHINGFVLMNYNCVILDTSPVNIGSEVFIGPGVCISCAGHAIHTDQRSSINTSRPITIEDKVWIGANSTICGGVTIGNGSVIGAGSVVTKDVPSGVVACGVPCKVIRRITEKDKIAINENEQVVKLN